MDKKHLYSVVMIVGVIAVIAAFQKHVAKIPALGVYLPGGTSV